MNLTINLEGIQEDKNYVLEFCLTSDGKKIVKGKSPSPRKKTEKKEDGAPSIDDFSKPTPPPPPSMGKAEQLKPSDIKIESSFDGKIDPTK